MKCYGRGQAGSIRETRPRRRGQTASDLAPGRAGSGGCSCCRRLLGQAADVAVAQAVVDEGEQLAGGGDLGDVVAAPYGQPRLGGGERAEVDLLDGLDGSPAHEVVAL